MTAGLGQGARRKIRKTLYMLQELDLVLTYIDDAAGEWLMFLPDEVRKAIGSTYLPFLDMAREGVKRPSARDLRFVSILKSQYGGEDDR